MRMASNDSALIVAILTYNEARRLPSCLAAIPECYPVVVIDSGSTDNTRELARNSGCRVVENVWPGFAAQRNFVLQKCGINSKWVLFVDADEIYLQQFYDWFEGHGRDAMDFDVGQIASLLVFQKKTLHYAPGYPLYHPRLVRCGHVTFIPNHTGHGETVDASARVRYIDIPYLHYWFDGDIVTWMIKHVKLAAQEATTMVPVAGHSTARARLSLLLRWPALRTITRFFYHYVWCTGFRDGWHGLAFSVMYGWFETTKGLIRFIERKGS